MIRLSLNLSIYQPAWWRRRFLDCYTSYYHLNSVPRRQGKWDGKSKQRVRRSNISKCNSHVEEAPACVRFGRFLDFSTIVEFPKNFTERRFRAYWQNTDPKETNERIRFKAMLKQIEDAPT
jgi:hypothetical protein